MYNNSTEPFEIKVKRNKSNFPLQKRYKNDEHFLLIDRSEDQFQGSSRIFKTGASGWNDWRLK